MNKRGDVLWRKDKVGSWEANQHGDRAPTLGSAPARLPRLLRARLAAPGSSALPEREAGPLGAPPPPRVLERAASIKVADLAAFGATQVTFQPDFTQPTCQGQWCPQFRGADSLTTLQLK